MLAPPPLILIVDDEPAFLLILTDLLMEEGYRVACAADGQAALNQVAIETPDVFVSDIQMPRVDGVKLVHRLRTAGHTFPIFLMSARHAPTTMPNVRFMGKPIDLDRLIETVRVSLDGGAIATPRPRGRTRRLWGEHAPALVLR